MNIILLGIIALGIILATGFVFLSIQDDYQNYSIKENNTPNKKPIVFVNKENPIKIGILHSLSGTMAMSESAVVESTLMAIEEINDRGGILGREVVPIEKVFDPLITTKQRGTGLGLASVKNIVEQHNGSISVKNNPTTFTVKIPKIDTIIFS